jgi:hypothetical protein
VRQHQMHLHLHRLPHLVRKGFATLTSGPSVFIQVNEHYDVASQQKAQRTGW